MVKIVKITSVICAGLFLVGSLGIIAGSSDVIYQGNGSSGSNHLTTLFPTDIYDSALFFNSSTTQSFDVRGVVVSTGFFNAYSSAKIISMLCERFRSASEFGSFTFITFQANSFRMQLLTDWQSVMSLNDFHMTAMPISPNSTKTYQYPAGAFFTASAVSLSFDPNAVMFGCNLSLNNIGAFESNIVGLSDFASSSQYSIALPQVNNSSGQFTPYSEVNFNYLGELGWYSNNSGNGFNEVLYKYCYAKYNDGGNEYYWFASNETQIVEGYHELFGGWKAWKYTQYTDYNTCQYPGQVLCSWAPQNSGCQKFSGSSPLMLTVGAGVAGFNVGLSFPIYCGSGPKLHWTGCSNPAEGIFDLIYRWVSGPAPGESWSVHSVTISELNPTKSGGVLPMLLYEMDPATLQAYDDAASCHMPYAAFNVCLSPPSNVVNLW